MYKWAVRWMIRRNLDALRQGDPGPLLAGYADDAVLVFPGTSSWAGEHRGKTAIEAFLRRFLEAGIVGEAQDIVVNGPPWRTTVCMVFLDHALDDAGDVVYENRAVIFGRIVWGKIVYHEDFEDTQKAEAFDAYLARRASSVS
ncbi:MAG TPA: nuclear transport factor 2 family protein [Acidimicrobiales bacterium]